MTTIFTSRLVRRSLSAALLLAVSGAGCTDDPAMMEGEVDPTDTTAPAIVDSVPVANATGIAADQKITVTFSEQMDPATILAAYSSSQLPLDKVSMVWNSAGTVLTISPDAAMEYAAGNGTDPSSVLPLTYAITIGAEAADLAGNPLGAPMQLSFATKRRLTGSFGTDPNLTKAVLGTSVLSGVNLFVGDNSAGDRYHSYVSFDLSQLPDGADVESATFDGTQLAPYGSPYTLGGITAHHISYSSMDNISAVQALSLPGMFSSDATLESKSIDVTAQVTDDVLHRMERGDLSQYRLQIDNATNGNNAADAAVFTKNTFDLVVTYVVD